MGAQDRQAAGSAEPVLSVFDTADSAPGERFQAWRDSIGVIFDIEAANDGGPDADGYRARIDSALCGEVMINRCRAGAQAFRRDAVRPLRDGVDAVMVQVFARGGVRAEDDARTLAGPGAVVGFDLVRPMATVNSDFDLINLFIPRDRIAKRLDRPDSLHLAAVDPGEPLGGLTADYLAGLQGRIDGMDAQEAATGVEAAIGLIAECFNGRTRRSDTEPFHAHALLETLKGKVRAAVTTGRNPGVEEVVAMSGASRAGVYRMFEPLGGIAAFIRAERLRAALRMIAADPPGRERPLGEIAQAHGFASDSHFTRAFRAEFGVAPSQARRMLRAGLIDPPGGADVPAAAAEGLDRRYELWLRAVCAG